MNYCAKCGCYIPENMFECPACGYSAAAAVRKIMHPELMRETKKEEYRKWADEELKKRRQENSEKAAISEPVEKEESEKENRLLAALSYISILCFLPNIIKADEFSRFHAQQGKMLLCYAIIAEITGWFISSFWAVQALRLLFVICGVKNALQGREEPLPVIGRKG